MAISRIASQDATGTSSTTSVSATYAATPTSGNLLIAVVLDNGANAGTTTITGWTVANSTSSSSSAESWVFYKVSNGSESTTVTANNSDASSMIIAIFEYTGISSPVLDQTNSGSSAIGGTSINTGTTSTTTAANELLFVEGAIFGVAATSPSWNNSFSLITSTDNNTGLQALFTGQQIVAATGAYNSTVSFTGVASNANAIIVTFKAGAAATTTNQLAALGAG